MSDLISRAEAIAAATQEGAYGYISAQELAEMPSAERTDISEILQFLDEKLHPIVSPDHWNVYSELHDMISTLSAELQDKCDGCFYLDRNGTTCEFCARNYPDQYSTKKEGEKE